MFFQSCFLSDFIIIDCLFLFRGLFFILYSLFFIPLVLLFYLICF
ncbi:putative membrane protein [Helicobacter pylori R030b]|nr:putative membrane protein [Helicobacter pylori R030b]